MCVGCGWFFPKRGVCSVWRSCFILTFDDLRLVPVGVGCVMFGMFLLSVRYLSEYPNLSFLTNDAPMVVNVCDLDARVHCQLTEMCFFEDGNRVSFRLQSLT